MHQHIEMTTSSKKRRGKQRKAANVQKEITAKHDYDVRKYTESLTRMPPNTVIKAIQRRDEVATEAVADFTLNVLARREFDLGASAADVLYYKELIGGGLIPTMIDLLNEGCSEELVGDFHSPSFPGTCMTLLANIARDDFNDSFRLQIASSIGPVLNCMQNEVDRQFFKSNNHWYRSLTFVYLIGNLLFTGKNQKEIMQVLCEYQGLFDCIVRMMFWDTYRPDLVKEAKTFDFT